MDGNKQGDLGIYLAGKTTRVPYPVHAASSCHLDLDGKIFSLTISSKSSCKAPCQHISELQLISSTSTMKFVTIAAASFLAANAVVVAAYEVPRDNLIAELVDEYDAEMDFFDAEDEFIEKLSESASASGLRGSSFDEKQKKEKRQKYLKTYVEGCKRCKYWKEQLEKETSGPKKKNAMKHFEQAAAAAFRAEAHLSPKGKADWKAFQEEHGASASERMADEWMKRHGSSYEEDASFDDIASQFVHQSSEHQD
eukprot:scaffold12347_cov100-Skeletonema_dohrnii-CCMP3373.AAC.4